MIKFIDGNIFDSKANFICHSCNCIGVMGAGVAAQAACLFPHVEKEYRKYLHYCKKHNIEPLGTVQYVPTQYWALGLVDTIKNNYIDTYDKDYQYIVNLFGQSSVGTGLQTDLTAMRKAFEDIKRKAKSVGATIAVPYKIGSCRGGANWNDIYKIITDVFGDNKVDVEIWKYDLG